MKNIKHLFKYAFLLILVAGFSGCEKDNLTLLTDGEWQFKNFTTTSDDEDIQSLVALGKAIMTDGTLSFSESGSYVLDSPVIEEEAGTYELIGNNQILFNDGIVRTATIDEISKKTLVYLETYVYLDDIVYTVKYTWEK